MLSGESSDKHAAVIYVWNKELHINVRLNQAVRLIANSSEHPAALFKGKIPEDWTIVCWHDEADDCHW